MLLLYFHRVIMFMITYVTHSRVDNGFLYVTWVVKILYIET